MTTLALPMDSVEVSTRQLVAASDWKDGASLRRYRDTFRPREFTLRRVGGRGDLALYEAAAADKSARSWTPPIGTAPAGVIAGDLSVSPFGTARFTMELTLIELRSVD